MVVIVRTPYVYVYVYRVGILFFFFFFTFSYIFSFFFLSINCWMGDGETFFKKKGEIKERKKEKEIQTNVFSNETLAFSFSYIGNA